MEKRYGSTAKESVEKLPDSITRQVLVSKGHVGSVLELRKLWDWDFHPPFSIESDSYYLDALVQLKNNMPHPYLLAGDVVLGIREEVRKRRTIILEDGANTEFIEAEPQVRNVWVGNKGIGLYTPDEAAKINYMDDKTALEWATINGNGVDPEMVVQANDGYFHPATKNDIVLVSIPKKQDLIWTRIYYG